MFFGIFGFIALICCGLADDKTTVGFLVTIGIVIPILAMLVTANIMGVIIWSFLVAVFYFMFFGAGNLIFPGHLGYQLGSQYFIGMLGFIITGVGLPLLAILACSKGDGTFEGIAEKISKKFAIIFTSVLFLSIGPLLAVPSIHLSDVFSALFAEIRERILFAPPRL